VIISHSIDGVDAANVTTAVGDEHKIRYHGPGTVAHCNGVESVPSVTVGRNVVYHGSAASVDDNVRDKDF
jgi:hypothetical protein